jgi:hypothetical protein
MVIPHIAIMENQRIKEIIYNLERLLNELKKEVYFDSVDQEEHNLPILDYDEIFEESNEY